MRAIGCRHCGKVFVPTPDKAGFINECPVCVEERIAEAAATAESEETVDLLKESIRASKSAAKS